ncbi:hypothetical protein CF319_g2636 [Tilletia indica]|nr:hypothetical protein CF319_g2636 [Tilletia indica]
MSGPPPSSSQPSPRGPHSGPWPSPSMWQHQHPHRSQSPSISNHHPSNAGRGDYSASNAASHQASHMRPPHAPLGSAEASPSRYRHASTTPDPSASISRGPPNTDPGHYQGGRATSIRDIRHAPNPYDVDLPPPPSHLSRHLPPLSYGRPSSGRSEESRASIGQSSQSRSNFGSNSVRHSPGPSRYQYASSPHSSLHPSRKTPSAVSSFLPNLDSQMGPDGPRPAYTSGSPGRPSQGLPNVASHSSHSRSGSHQSTSFLSSAPSMPHYVPMSTESSRLAHERTQVNRPPELDSVSPEDGSSGPGSLPTPLSQGSRYMTGPSASIPGRVGSESRDQLNLDANGVDHTFRIQHPSYAFTGEQGIEARKRARTGEAGFADEEYEETGEGSSKRTFKKRSHAKRTCQKCQKLKARCVLPDVNVQSSESPLPVELSCERCVKRGSACVVNDRRGPKAPPPGYIVRGQLATRSPVPSEPGSSQAGPPEKEERHPAEHFADSARSSMFPGQDDVIWQTMHSERLIDKDHEDPVRTQSAEIEGGDRERLAPLIAPTSQAFSVFRPLALFSHLINGIISKSSADFETKFGSARCTYVLDACIAPPMLVAMDQKFESLRGWAPHLPDLGNLRDVALSPQTGSPDSRFLVSVICWITLTEGGFKKLASEAKASLKADIVASTLRCLTSLPASIYVVHALVLLATHSTIDFELDRSSTTDHIPGRGLIAAARSIASVLNIPQALTDIVSGPRVPLQREDRLIRLSSAALWLTICVQESHITLAQESLMNASLDRLPAVDETMLAAYEREATVLLGDKAYGHLTLVHRVRVCKRVEKRVQDLYLTDARTPDYKDLIRQFKEMFADFDELRLEKEVTFGRFSGLLSDKLSDWIQLEMDGIEECICQRFNTYVSIGTFRPPPEIDTKEILRQHMNNKCLNEFTYELHSRNEVTMVRYLSLFANMTKFLSVVPQVVTFSIVMRAAKVILEQSTARMIGWKAVPPNVDTLELLITSAARAFGSSFGNGAAELDFASRAAGGGERGGRGSGVQSGGRGSGGRDGDSEQHGQGRDTNASPASPIRTYSFSQQFPCGSAESIPLICTYLLHEMAIALNRRTRLFRLLEAQTKRAERGRGQDPHGSGTGYGADERDGRNVGAGSGGGGGGGAPYEDVAGAGANIGGRIDRAQGTLTGSGHPGEMAAPERAWSGGGGSGSGHGPLALGSGTRSGMEAAPMDGAGFAGGHPGEGGLMQQHQQQQQGMLPHLLDSAPYAGMDASSSAMPGFDPNFFGGNLAGDGSGNSNGTGLDLVDWGPFVSQGRSKLLLDSLMPASWIDTVFQAGGFTFNPADFS